MVETIKMILQKYFLVHPILNRNKSHYICYAISELQDLLGHSECKKFPPTVPQATKFRISISSEGKYVGEFSCIEGYHMIGSTNAVCDPTKIAQVSGNMQQIEMH